jgi:hypothetical protein
VGPRASLDNAKRKILLKQDGPGFESKGSQICHKSYRLRQLARGVLVLFPNYEMFEHIFLSKPEGKLTNNPLRTISIWSAGYHY